jgi:3-deoxy-D-manno-octulosonic-acid transferase
MILFIYRFLFTPIAYGLAGLVALKNNKMRKFFDLRQGKPWLAKNMEGAIWFHTSSGEIEYAKPLFRALKAKNPTCKILVTYFSPSVVKSLEKIPEVDFFCPSPWENKKIWQEFLALHKPKSLWISRTDFWLEMLTQTEKAGIPMYLFAATLNENQKKFRSRISKWWYGWQLRRMREIFCVSHADQKAFATWGFPSAIITGDPRYIQVAHRLQEKRNLPLQLKPTRKVFLAASTWPEDELIVLPFFAQIQKDWSSILVPHEPTPSHIEHLESTLTSLEIPFQKWSATSMWNGYSILLVDTVGVLADIYRHADLSLIGGSFKSSVHSVMESLGAGVPAFVGPHHQNNREAVDFQNIYAEIAGNKLSFVTVVRSQQELYKHWSQIKNLDYTDVKKFLQSEFTLKERQAFDGIELMLSTARCT